VVFTLDDFDFITHAENMTRTKPKIAYYQELIQKLNLNPDNCLMIGNDIVKDMPAFEAGMKNIFCLKRTKNVHSIYKIKDKRINLIGNYNNLKNLISNRFQL
jgi:FMN phosphatase YigB (HAD superfamily)